jgi:hypothetical protein
MNLRASLARVQNLGARFYLQLAKHFDQNTLIRDTWVGMADDFQNQVSSLKELRPLFWRQLQTEEKTLVSVTRDTADLLRVEIATPPSEWSLQACFTRTLGFEEPIIIKLYAPLLYRLRRVGTDHALDFYIMVNAHVIRLTRLIQLFSGDPALIERCSALFHGFERAAQGPPPEPVIARKKTRLKKSAARRHRLSPVKTASKRLLGTRKTVKPRRPLAKRSKVVAKRSKPLVKNLNLRRRRARR